MRQTREQLLTAGLDLLAEKGYLGATTREIANSASVTEVTLYRHFRSKDELFESAIIELGARLTSLVPEPSGDMESDLLLFTQKSVEHMSSTPSILHIASDLRDYPRPREAIRKIIHQYKERVAHLIHYYQANGELVQDNDGNIIEGLIGPIYIWSQDITSDTPFNCSNHVKYFVHGYRNHSE